MSGVCVPGEEFNSDEISIIDPGECACDMENVGS